MLDERQMARLDETIRRLIVEIGRREGRRGSALNYGGDSCKDYADALETLVRIKRDNRIDTNNEVNF